MKVIALKGKHGQGHYALVSDEDYDFLSRWEWHRSVTGYAARGYTVGGRYVYVKMHHAVAGKYEGKHVDHINRDPLDNRRTNLRIATVSENIQNQRRKKTTASGFRGVTWHYSVKQWRTRIKIAGKETLIGYYETASEASQAYEAFRDKHVDHYKKGAQNVV